VQQSTVKGHSLASLFSTTDNNFHSRFRRCVNSAFSMSSLVQYEPFVDNTTKLFLDQTSRLFANKASGCDFTRWLQFYAFDVIGEITYSKRHGFIEKNEDVEGIVSYLSNLFLYVAPVSRQEHNRDLPLLTATQIGQIPILDRFLYKNPLYMKLSQWGFSDATMPIARFARNRMAERLGTKPVETEETEDPEAPTVKSADLLSKFLSAQSSHPDFMSDTLVQTMAISMAFAGSETTAISLSAVFYYLMRNPEKMARLRQEIDDAARDGTFSNVEDGIVTWSEAQTLPYLDACIKEAFRLHPAAGLPLERIVPEPGVEIAGHYIKGGTIVGCSAWIIHRRKEIWGDDVDEYRPERWLTDADLSDKERVLQEAKVKAMNGFLFQFGMGSRTCLGKNISLLEIYKLVPTMLRRFEVCYPPKRRMESLGANSGPKQIEFKDPSQDWQLINAWFVKQTNFDVLLKDRQLHVASDRIHGD
jgi:cytochrome P450